MYETRDMNLLQNVFNHYEYLIERPYLYELACLPSATFCVSDAPIQILKISTLSTCDTYIQLSYALNALADLNHTVGCLLICNQGELSLYILLKGCAISSIFYTSFLQTFPGSSLSYIQSPTQFLNALFNYEKYASLASGAVVPNSSYQVPLLQQFANLMGTSSNYVALFLAEPLPRQEIRHCLREFYDIYTTLDQFTQTNYTDYKSDSKSVTNSTAKGSTNTSSKSTTNTHGDSSSNSHNCYTNLSASTPLTLIAHRPSTTTSTTTTQGNLPSTTTTTTTSPSTTSTPTSPRNINATVLTNRAKGSASTFNSSRAHGETCGDSSSLTSTHGNSSSQTFYHAAAFSIANKRVQDALSSITTILSRYSTLSKNATFCFSSYFFSPNRDTSLRAAHTYVGLSQSSYEFSPNIVNHWSYESPQYQNIFSALKQLTHPSFCFPPKDLTVSNTVPISSTELVNTIYYPIRSNS